ncbi:cell wall hydrolase [Maricaulis parjimensis]|uniref:cell wall hydrolase n=1 Tax=Maricaulis parjimensis TaxID=144023 RepID=UPI001EEEF01F|nr:cell wall hydrolase [Maricaulis parjimensis]
MNLDEARSQQKQVATAFYMLAALVLCAMSILVMNLASERARVQDETLQWQRLASQYLDRGDTLDADTSAELVRIASISLASDPLQGAVLTVRSLDDLRTFDTTHFDHAADITAQIDCLAEAVYYEARSEGIVGQLAVAQVVLNRVRNRNYPDTICDVVYEGSERTTGCQFTFTCDGSLIRAPRGNAWRRSQLVAQHAYLGFGRDVTRRATHYHTVAVDPYWNESLVRTRRIGTHIFYRFATRREREAGIVRERDA